MGKIIRDKFGKIAYIYFCEDTIKYNTYLVDTNILIDIEKGYYEPYKLSDEQKNYLIEYFRTNRGIGKDPVYGMAIQESCWNYKFGKIDQNKLKKIEDALDVMNKWNGTAANLHYSRQQKVIKYDFLDDNKKELKHIGNQIMYLNPLLLYSYPSILKMLILEKKNNLKNRKKTVLEFLDFIDKELKCNCAYETFLFVEFMLGSNHAYDLASNVFKFQKKVDNPLMKAINIAWDFSFIRLAIDMILNPNNSQSKNAILISCDKGLIALAELISLKVVFRNDNFNLPVIEIEDLDLKNEFIDFAKEINSRIYNQTTIRMITRGNIVVDDNELERVKKIIYDLETEIVAMDNENMSNVK